jgi:hypothetical protein
MSQPSDLWREVCLHSFGMMERYFINLPYFIGLHIVSDCVGLTPLLSNLSWKKASLQSMGHLSVPTNFPTSCSAEFCLQLYPYLGKCLLWFWRTHLQCFVSSKLSDAILQISPNMQPSQRRVVHLQYSMELFFLLISKPQG